MADTDDAPATAARDGATQREAVKADHGSVTSAVVTINKPAQELYDFWRHFPNLAGVLENVESIVPVDGGTQRTRWTVKSPAGTRSWDALVTEDEPGRVVGWASTEGSEVRNSGRVEFKEVPGRGTVVRAVIGYDPPGGAVGAFIANLFGREPSVQARRDLRRFKQFMETGEIATSSRTRAHDAEHKAG